MSPKLFALILLVLTYYAVSAQTVALQVKLVAPGRDSVPNATIQLYSWPDSVLLQQKLSSEKNILHVKPNSKYRINVIAIGYAPLQQNIAIANKPLMLMLMLVPVTNNLINDTIKRLCCMNKI